MVFGEIPSEWTTKGNKILKSLPWKLEASIGRVVRMVGKEVEIEEAKNKSD